jgi:hypothetical protein
MTSRELVISTLKFSSPPRVPRQLWLLPWAADHFPRELAEIQKKFPDDIVNCPAFFKTTPQRRGSEYLPGIYVDEWGCIFENRQRGLIGEVKEPLVKNWKEVDKVRVPRERLSTDVRRANEFVRAADQFVLAPTTIRPFEQLQFIRGSQNLYLDLIDQPDELFILLEHIHSFYKEELELWASTDVDGLSFADDWGSQKSLLISPGLWRKIFRPLYKEYVEIAHRRGKFIFMHSDGHISEIFPDLVELRVDALNSQLFCMDIESLGNRFRGRITFWGEVDRQHILAEGKPEEVVAAVRRVKNALYRDGGVIAQCEFGAGARPENVALVFETWNKMVCSKQ